MDHATHDKLRITEQRTALEAAAEHASNNTSRAKLEAAKMGDVVSFTRRFDEPTPVRSLKETGAGILAVEQEPEGLLESGAAR